MLTRHVVGADGKGRDVKLSDAEEAAMRAEWAAEDQKPREQPVSIEDRLAKLEAAVKPASS